MGVLRCARSLLRRIFGGRDRGRGQNENLTRGQEFQRGGHYLFQMDAAPEQMVAEQDAEVFPDID